MMKASFFLSLLFSSFAAAVAFFITYAEYARRLTDRKKVLKRALEMGLVSFVFFSIVPPLLIWLFLIL
jgi:hypothetical protein